MRIAFICSGLEPGRDGVGDFARTVARQCHALGHETRLAAVRESGNRGEIAANPAELRLNDIFQNPDEASALAKWLREYQPDWVSVQVTPFGFHPRGLGARRAKVLRELMPASARRHIMLHEIWLQPGRDGAWRHRALGWAQKRSVDAWAGLGWRPALIHTQARLHRARLQARGFAVELLPLCTNFPRTEISRAAARATVAEGLRAKGQTIDEVAIWLGHFGAFHTQNWDFPEFAKRMAASLDLQGRRICFLALGRSTAASAALAEAARALLDVDFCLVGELRPEQVPVAMEACDAAFTSTPWDIVEKSGAVAAWRGQDVPVLVTRAGASDAEKLPPWPDSGLILADASSNLSTGNIFNRVPGPAFLQPAEAARNFIAALESAPTRP
jgi:hypothetical protein